MWQFFFLATSVHGTDLDLLFISEDIVLELPNFRKFPCNFIDPWPFDDSRDSPTGIVNNSLIACDRGKGCSRLDAGRWTRIKDMTTLRSRSGASDTSLGWFITGGYDSGGTPLKSTELLTSDGEWRAGPDLPASLTEHCQVKRGNKIFVIGKRRFIQISCAYVVEVM